MAQAALRIASSSSEYSLTSLNQYFPASAERAPTSSEVQDREALYAEFAPLVRRLIRQYGDSPEMRQDLAGEIYYRFCTLLEAYDPARGIPLRPYLVRQLTASVYTYARAGWRSQKREVSLEGVSGTAEIGTKEDPSREWDERISTEQVLHSLPEAIAKLPKRQRQVLIWRYYEERSFEEIADLLDVQLATTRSLLRHAINNLKKEMAAQVE